MPRIKPETVFKFFSGCPLAKTLFFFSFPLSCSALSAPLCPARRAMEIAGSSSATVANDKKPLVEQQKCVEEETKDCLVEGDFGEFVPSPLVPLKVHLEKDKEDESLRRWKEKLLGSFQGDLNGQMEPEVVFQSIGIVSDDFGEIITPLPLDESQSSNVLFALKEGSVYRLKLKFAVKHNIVSGLAYTNTVWKAGVQVDQSSGMLGTFAPQGDPYLHLLEEETTPSGMLARGVYSAQLKFEDDDKKCHMELKYSFEIKKE